ncbi:hypothetical protein [Bradyrhizobium lablabi]|uniref:hypothetical protein n=1 Tax=Bradyrhizobium lablabi TaxID=722472 RepID=UPI001BAA2941|nr:hypothetical protein [Bradyrhizobium lablabi]MBR0695649.1 hypothetical protein [Bradyrhizobium lablabi]
MGVLNRLSSEIPGAAERARAFTDQVVELLSIPDLAVAQGLTHIIQVAGDAILRDNLGASTFDPCRQNGRAPQVELVDHGRNLHKIRGLEILDRLRRGAPAIGLVAGISVLAGYGLAVDGGIVANGINAGQSTLQVSDECHKEFAAKKQNARQSQTCSSERRRRCNKNVSRSEPRAN